MKNTKTLTMIAIVVAVLILIVLSITIPEGWNNTIKNLFSKKPPTSENSCYKLINKEWQTLSSEENWKISAPKDWKLIKISSQLPEQYILQEPGATKTNHGEIIRSGISILVLPSQGKTLEDFYSLKLSSGEAKVVILPGLRIVQFEEEGETGGTTYVFEHVGKIYEFNTGSLQTKYASLIPEIMQSFGGPCINPD